MWWAGLSPLPAAVAVWDGGGLFWTCQAALLRRAVSSRLWGRCCLVGGALPARRLPPPCFSLHRLVITFIAALCAPWHVFWPCGVHGPLSGGALCCAFWWVADPRRPEGGGRPDADRGSLAVLAPDHDGVQRQLRRGSGLNPGGLGWPRGRCQGGECKLVLYCTRPTRAGRAPDARPTRGASGNSTPPGLHRFTPPPAAVRPPSAPGAALNAILCSVTTAGGAAATAQAGTRAQLPRRACRVKR